MIGRKNELNQLEQMYHSEKFEFLIMTCSARRCYSPYD